MVRVPKIFEGLANEVIEAMGGTCGKQIGHDYYLIKTEAPEQLRESKLAKFLRWKLPLNHAWPCNPTKTDGFVEKAAQGLLRKFGERKPQGLFIGQLNPGSPDRYFKQLATNLRGRTLQLFHDLRVATVEDQRPEEETLFCHLGREGLYAGMSTPRDANGFYPGGSMYVAQNDDDVISRAGAKIAEALHYLPLHRSALRKEAHWLELGACPGGMTSELLARGYRVTAIDRAPLDPRLMRSKGLAFLKEDVGRYRPGPDDSFDAILCDLNGPPEESIGHVIRLSHSLRKGGLAIFTLKVPKIESTDEPCALFDTICGKARASGLDLITATHLTYNRHEFTLFFERAAA